MSGDRAYRSANFTPTQPGTYRWIAAYSGDANNAAVAGSCNEPSQSVTVSKARPVLTTKASLRVPLGGRVHDTANLARGSSPTGKLIFKLYGPNNARCSRAPVFTTSRIAVGQRPLCLGVLQAARGRDVPLDRLLLRRRAQQAHLERLQLGQRERDAFGEPASPPSLNRPRDQSRHGTRPFDLAARAQLFEQEHVQPPPEAMLAAGRGPSASRLAEA